MQGLELNWMGGISYFVAHRALSLTSFQAEERTQVGIQPDPACNSVVESRPPIDVQSWRSYRGSLLTELPLYFGIQQKFQTHAYITLWVE